MLSFFHDAPNATASLKLAKEVSARTVFPLAAKNSTNTQDINRPGSMIA